MHGKKKYTNKSSYSIQGIRPVGNSLPHGLKTILKKGGYNYSSIINNWSEIVGKKIAQVTYPKSVKTGKELKNGTLLLNVHHGDQLTVEYSKKEIVDRINSFFGYQFIKNVKLVLIRGKIKKIEAFKIDKQKVNHYKEKIEKIEGLNLKKNLSNLIDAFSEKKINLKSSK